MRYVEMKWVLLDFDGNPIRYFSWNYPGTVKVKPKPIDWSTVEECLF